MRSSTVLGVAMVLALAGAASGQAIFSNGDAGNPNNPRLSTGPTTLSGVAAPAGFNWSEVANDSPNGANTSAGSSAHRTGTTGAFRLADNFTITDPAGWQIDSVCFYSYQTGFPGPGTPFANMNLQIWNGRPGDVGSTVIFGDTTTNRLASSDSAGLYRIFNTVAPAPGTAPGTTRLIYENEASAGLTLGPGTYWLDWQYIMAGTSTTFSPTITIPGTRTVAGWNGRQFVTTGWVDALDTGNPGSLPDVPQDFPFIIKGEIIPAPGAMALLGMGGLIALRRRR